MQEACYPLRTAWEAGLALGWGTAELRPPTLNPQPTLHMQPEVGEAEAILAKASLAQPHSCGSTHCPELFMISALTFTLTLQKLAPRSAPPGLQSWGRTVGKPTRAEGTQPGNFKGPPLPAAHLSAGPSLDSKRGDGLKLGPPLLFLASHSVPAQSTKRSDQGLGGTGALPGIQARLPALLQACSLHGKLAEGRQETSGATVCSPRSSRRGPSPALLSVPAAPGPSSL